MPLFAYRARDQQGILVTGRMEGDNTRGVKIFLGEQGLIPLRVRPVEQREIPWRNVFFSKKTRTEDLVFLTRHFHTLFRSGLSMESILRILANQANRKTMREALLQIEAAVAEGETLAQAFSKHPRMFSELYTNMLTVGEEAGILEGVLKNLADLLQQEVTIKAEIKAATLYPKIVIGFLAVAALVMLLVVVPKFAQFYAHYNAQLPLPTLILLATSNFLRRFFWILLPLLGLGYFFFQYLLHTPSGKYRWDRFRLALPVFGPLALKVANVRFANILSSLYQSGLPITRSLKLVEGVIENEVMAKEIRQIQTEIEKGKSISDAMRLARHFSPFLIEATATGEKTGTLDTMLQGIRDHLDAEIQHTLKNLTTLLEPMLLVAIFGLVTLFVLSIFLPIWRMSQAVFGH